MVMLGVFVLGYAASQYFYAQGVEAAVTYAERVNTPLVATAALVLLALVAIFAFLPQDATGNDPAAEGSENTAQ